MAIAHICRTCGIDLARVRSALEPRYGLRIVRCPACSGVSVRRRHPLGEWWHDLRRVDWALTVLVLNLGLLLLLLAGTVSAITWLVLETGDRTLPAVWRRDGAMMIVTLLVLPVCVGMWLTAGLPHWRRTAAWITFGALALGGLVVVSIALGLQDAMRRFEATPQPHRLLGSIIDANWLEQPADLAIRGGALLLLTMIAAAVGIVPGRGVARLIRAWRRSVWRWRYRRGRRERAG